MKNTLRAMHLVAILMFVCLSNAHAAESRNNTLGMEFIWIVPGEFFMGSTQDELDKVLFEMNTADMTQLADEAPRHKVRISKGFLIGRTEITQEQWLQVMKTKPGPADHWSRRDWKTVPVVSTSVNMAQQFAAKLSKMDKQYRYRLPTEAEWEYAARGGSSETRPEKLDEYAWSYKNSNDVPQPVATRKANGFGLYDMLGNAWEWVSDYHGEYPKVAQTDPTGPSKGKRAIRRGGSYHCPLYQMRPAFRSYDSTRDAKYTVTGFRLIAVEK